MKIYVVSYVSATGPYIFHQAVFLSIEKAAEDLCHFIDQDRITGLYQNIDMGYFAAEMEDRIVEINKLHLHV